MDFVTDQNFTRVFPPAFFDLMPTYVREADIVTPDGMHKIAAVCFAAPSKREFPVFSPATTWLSAAYFFGQENKSASVEENILAAAKTHGILDDVMKLKAAVSPTKAASAVDVDFALRATFCTHSGDNELALMYPIRSESEIREACVQLVMDQPRMPDTHFREASANLLKAAKAHGIGMHGIPNLIKKAGTPRIFDPATAMFHAELRERVAKKNEASGLYVEIVKVASEEPERQQSCVELVAALDETFGVACTNGVVAPMDMIFCGIPEDEYKKVAANTVFLLDAAVPLSELHALEVPKVKAAFGGAPLDTILKAAAADTADAADALLASLPKDSQRTLLRLLVGSK